MLEECCGKTQPRSVLEVVLIGCDGDLNEAMNEVLSMPPYDAAEMERAAARASAVAAEDAMSGAAAEDDEACAQAETGNLAPLRRTVPRLEAVERVNPRLWAALLAHGDLNSTRWQADMQAESTGARMPAGMPRFATGNASSRARYLPHLAP